MIVWVCDGCGNRSEYGVDDAIQSEFKSLRAQVGKMCDFCPRCWQKIRVLADRAGLAYHTQVDVNAQMLGRDGTLDSIQVALRG
jgi:hypothetical protein